MNFERGAADQLNAVPAALKGALVLVLTLCAVAGQPALAPAGASPIVQTRDSAVCTIAATDLTRTSSKAIAKNNATIKTSKTGQKTSIKFTRLFKMVSHYTVDTACSSLGTYTVAASGRVRSTVTRTRATKKAALRTARKSARLKAVRVTRKPLLDLAVRTAQTKQNNNESGTNVPYSGEFASAAWISAFRAELHQLTNQVRANAGVSALSYAPKLEPLADDWSRTVASSKTLSHDTGATGTSYDVLAACGTPVSAGENMGGAGLGSLQLKSGGIYVDARDTPAEAAHEAISAWVNSPGHYSAMTAPGHTGEAFGVAISLNREALEDGLDWIDGTAWITARFIKGPC